MKLLHLSDLHLGRRLMDVSLLEEQQHILAQILSVMDREQPDAVLIVGDVYDRSNPSADAMTLMDDFCRELAGRGKPVLIISGNHDAPERLAYAAWTMASAGIHIAPVYDGHIAPIPLEDEHGLAFFWLMPYIHPDGVRRFFPEETVSNANDAARLVIGEMAVDPAVRNVILSHQLILGGITCDSERRSIGTL